MVSLNKSIKIVYLTEKKLSQLAAVIDAACVSFESLDKVLGKYEIHTSDVTEPGFYYEGHPEEKKEKSNVEKITQLFLRAKDKHSDNFDRWLTQQIEYPFITEWLLQQQPKDTFLATPTLIKVVPWAISDRWSEGALDKAVLTEVFTKFGLPREQAKRLFGKPYYCASDLDGIMIKIYNNEQVLELACELASSGIESEKLLGNLGLLAESGMSFPMAEFRNALHCRGDALTLLLQLYNRERHQNIELQQRHLELEVSEKPEVGQILEVLNKGDNLTWYAREILKYRNWPKIRLWLKKHGQSN